MMIIDVQATQAKKSVNYQTKTVESRPIASIVNSKHNVYLI